MRVIQFIDTLRSGGKERQVVELLKGLTQTPGIECELIVMSEDTHYTYLDKLDIPVHILLRRYKKDPRIFLQLYRLLKQLQPDILHSWSSMCSIYTLPSIKLLDIQFVNGFLRDAPASFTISDKEWLRSQLTFPFSDAIVSNSKAGLNAYKVKPRKSSCIYNGFDFTRIEHLPPPEIVKKKHRITTEFTVGMVGSFANNKDFNTFIKAAHQILSKRRDVTFLAIGDGDTREQCMQSVAEKDKKYILFPGRLLDVESLVQVMTIGVLCSNKDVHGEGISNSIMEYMALCKPVVATDCGGNCELIIDNVTGYLLEAGDSGKLAERLLFLLNHPEIANKMGSEGRQHLAKEFSLSRMTAAYVKLYKNLLSS
jgi:glycosyltransferase involved in cell wall biosynthesis